LRFLIWRVATLSCAELLTSSLVEFRLNGALSRTSSDCGRPRAATWWRLVDTGRIVAGGGGLAGLWTLGGLRPVVAANEPWAVRLRKAACRDYKGVFAPTRHRVDLA
jgi:hypothetical protein